KPRYVTSDEYLSGNVREKLRQAQAAVAVSPIFEVNVKALEGVQPQDLSASEIDVRLGATWIDKKYIQEFMYETFNTPRRNRWSDYVYAANRYAVTVNFSPMTVEWNIPNKRAIPSIDVAAYRTYGTERASAYDLLEAALNLRDVKIYDKAYDADGKETRVLNQKETTLAQQKQQAIKDAFREWIWKDPERREDLVREYNERFNSTRPREYDGSHISFAGMNPEINLRPHQRNAIAHILYGGNTLLAHEVGAGKSATRS
ncbi:MAG: helicase SNF2, partial [Anaerolineaceae bacterium]|nr:helicase SNF2 [Anaerolineaceae bacterium]